jgi:hypothetical protein
MISMLFLTVATTTPAIQPGPIPCPSIAVIEASTNDMPSPFASLREQGKTTIMATNALGQRVPREVSITNVKAIPGFSRCRFVYSSQIDLACYVGTTLADSEIDAISRKLEAIGENVGQCLTNPNLVRAGAEAGSTPSVTFGGGPRHSFWQISMVPTQEDYSRVQPEILVLGPAMRPASPRLAKATPKAKRKVR